MTTNRNLFSARNQMTRSVDALPSNSELSGFVDHARRAGGWWTGRKIKAEINGEIVAFTTDAVRMHFEKRREEMALRFQLSLD